jgi:hypothetical protein
MVTLDRYATSGRTSSMPSVKGSNGSAPLLPRILCGLSMPMRLWYPSHHVVHLRVLGGAGRT